MRRLLILTLALLFPGIAVAAAPPERWVVYYTDKLGAEAFASFDLIVFDSDHHPPLTPLKEAGKTLLGYLSLGEAEEYRDYFKTLKKKKLLAKANPQWKGHYIIDMRKAAWKAYVLDTLIPAIRARGFDGIMLDTVDSPLYLEDKYPKRYHGMRSATVDVIRAIRQRYPDMKIMLNRGFDILPQVASEIDMVMAEDLFTTHPTDKEKPVEVPPETYLKTVELLKAAQAKAPQLKVYTLDYWPQEDVEGVKRLYARHRENGFIPYVSHIDLQTIVMEPQ